MQGIGRWAALTASVVMPLIAACQTISGIRRDVGLGGPSVADSSVGRMAFQGEPDLRIRVAAGVTSRDISGPDRLVVRPVAGMQGAPVSVRGPLKITSGEAGIRVAHRDGTATFAPGTDVEVASESKGAESIRVGETAYPGVVTIRPRWSSAPKAFDVVIAMPVETYLPGVLTHELWKDWPRQTFETQAIASRTYALHERSRARAEGRLFDMEDSTNDQVYGGATAAYVPNEAARATRGLVLVSDGRLLRAYYSSTCGGRPASAAMVWKTGPGYEFNLAAPLQGQPRASYCQASKYASWTVTRDDEDVTRRLRAWGTQFEHPVRSVGRVRAVEVESSNAAGRPNRMKLTDDKGATYSLTSEELRMALNQPVPGMPAVTMATSIKSGDLEARVWADQITFTGRGWGHGVGMCQWCAKGMADAGMDWATMLRAFYPGAEVVKAY